VYAGLLRASLVKSRELLELFRKVERLGSSLSVPASILDMSSKSLTSGQQVLAAGGDEIDLAASGRFCDLLAEKAGQADDPVERTSNFVADGSDEAGLVLAVTLEHRDGLRTFIGNLLSEGSKLEDLE
jgi:hypothetical protein